MVGDARVELIEFFKLAGVGFESGDGKWILHSTASLQSQKKVKFFVASQNQARSNVVKLWEAKCEHERSMLLLFLFELIDDLSSLKALLMPLDVGSSKANDSARTAPIVSSAFNDSLLRLIVQIPSIQPSIVFKLLAKVPEYESFMESEFLRDNIPRLIFNQLRWIQMVGDSKVFAANLREIITICASDAARCEIIGWIPEIADDALAEDICPFLLELLNDHPDLTSAILETLSSMRLNASFLRRTYNLAINMLASVESRHIPVLIKFLLQAVRSDELTTLVAAIRANLRVETLDSNHDLLIGCLRSCLRMRCDFANIYLNELSRVDASGDHSVLDFWMLVLIYNVIPSTHARIEQILKKKILLGCFSTLLVDRAIGGHGCVLEGFFDTIMTLGQYLMHESGLNSNDRLGMIAIRVYTASFATFDNEASRASIFSYLTNHLHSELSGEVDFSLLAMFFLVKYHMKVMENCSYGLQSLANHLDGANFNNDQVYLIYTILSHLGHYKLDERESGFAQYLGILLEKQVGSPESRYQNMGSLGCAAFIDSIVDTMDESDDPSRLDYAVQFIERHLKIGLNPARSALSRVLFVDRLSAIVSSDKHIHNLVLESILRGSEGHLKSFLKKCQDTDYNWCNDIEVESAVLMDYKLCNEPMVVDYKLCNKPMVVDFGRSSESHGESILVANSLMRLYCFAKLKLDCQVNSHLLQLVFAGFKLFPRLRVENAIVLNAHLNGMTPRSLEGMVNGLIHAIGWVLESLNVMVNLPQSFHKYVGIRMSHLVELETMLDLILSRIDEYPLHLASLAPTDYTTQVNEDAGSPIQSTTKKKKRSSFFSSCNANSKFHFCNYRKNLSRRCIASRIRTFDGKTLNILSMVNVATPPDGQEECAKPSIDLRALWILLENLEKKICALINPKRQMNVHSIRTNEKDPNDFYEFYPALKSLCIHLKSLTAKIGTMNSIPISSKVSDIGNENDHIKMSDINSDNNDHIKISVINGNENDHTSLLDSQNAHQSLIIPCVRKILHILHIVFSWNRSSEQPITESSLIVGIASTLAANRGHSANEILAIFFERLNSLLDTINNVDTNVELMELLNEVALHIRPEGEFTPNHLKFIGLSAERTLKNNGLNCKMSVNNLKKILNLYLNCDTGDFPFERLETVAKLVYDLCHRIASGDQIPEYAYKSLTPHNLHVYYQVLVDKTVELFLSQLEVSEDEGKDARAIQLNWMGHCLNIYQYLLSCNIELQYDKLIRTALKSGRIVVKEFSNRCEWICSHLDSHTDQVHEIICMYQISSRRLQYTCNKIKEKKDEKLGFLIPLLKKSIETVMAKMRVVGGKFGFSNAIDIKLLSPFRKKNGSKQSRRNSSKSPSNKRKRPSGSIGGKDNHNRVDRVEDEKTILDNCESQSQTNSGMEYDDGSETDARDDEFEEKSSDENYIDEDDSNFDENDF